MIENQPLVYIVDDDPSVRKSLSRLLAVAGYSAVTCASAQEYLETGYAKGGPHCLILDIRLPGMGGLELQKLLSKEKLAPPIIFITGHGDIPTSVGAMKAGAIDFLAKPFSDEALLNAVGEALEKSRYESAIKEDISDIQRRLELLTAREREVLRFVVKGWLNKQIGVELGITEKTVKVHRGRAMQKLRVRSLAELVRLLEKVESGEQTGDA